MLRHVCSAGCLVLIVAGTLARTLAVAQGETAKKVSEPAKTAAGSLDSPAMTRLAPNYDIWIDPKRKIVVVDGKVVLREGALEMFACPKGTKEHESIVAVNSNAQFVHAGLIAVGAEPGHPVVFAPEYKPAT